ncbi:MAG: phosphomannomutase/phosphoglucomutase [Spirochaetia bacterium]|jgi:phosphomannomutase
MSVFKTYDIRGVWGSEVDPSLADRIGRALARYMKADSFLLGYDARLHSPELYNAMANGLVEEGKKVAGTGLASTPQLHYTQIDGGFPAAVMVTASHNPPQYHGFKVFDARGGSLSYDKGLRKVEALVAGIPAPSAIAQQAVRRVEGLDSYVAFVAKASGGKTLGARIVIDVSNGSAGPVFRRLAETLGMDAVVLNSEPDGNFPSHDPNPLKAESREQAAKAVREARAAFGVVLDGDGDRILFVDEKGQGIENYFLSCLVAEELLARAPGAAIVYDLISSRVLPERIRELGGEPVVSRVGYTFLYDRMVASRAVFGAETSGHVYFKVSDTYFTESAAYALVVLMGLLATRGRPLSEMVAPLRSRYFQSPEINVEVKDKQKAMREIERRYAKGRVDKLDGVSVEFEDFWFNVRPSNTEPVLRLRLEARRAEVAQARTEEIKAILSA